MKYVPMSLRFWKRTLNFLCFGYSGKSYDYSCTMDMAYIRPSTLRIALLVVSRQGYRYVITITYADVAAQAVLEATSLVLLNYVLIRLANSKS